MPEEAEESAGSSEEDATIEEWRERVLELAEEVPAGSSSSSEDQPSSWSANEATLREVVAFYVDSFHSDSGLFWTTSRRTILTVVLRSR